MSDAMWKLHRIKRLADEALAELQVSKERINEALGEMQVSADELDKARRQARPIDIRHKETRKRCRDEALDRASQEASLHDEMVEAEGKRRKAQWDLDSKPLRDAIERGKAKWDREAKEDQVYRDKAEWLRQADLNDIFRSLQQRQALIRLVNREVLAHAKEKKLEERR